LLFIGVAMAVSLAKSLRVDAEKDKMEIND